VNPHDLLKQLDRDGAQLELSLRGSNLTPEHKALIRDNRDDLITLLAARHISGSDYYLNIATSSGKVYVMAKPHHLDEAVSLYPWGVVFDSKDRLITTWGDVPTSALLDKRDLLTDEPLVPETRAA
jgi:hypothetical protein